MFQNRELKECLYVRGGNDRRQQKSMMKSFMIFAVQQP
jgi:hypothetical protein